MVFSLQFSRWEDGKFINKILHKPDRWEVHSAEEVLVTIHGDIPPVRIIQQPTSITATKVGVGACLWDGAILLAAYLAAQPHHKYIGTRCIELGAGVGLVGLVAAKLGAHVVITDIDKVMPLLWENLEANAYPRDAPNRNKPGIGWASGDTLEWGAPGYMDVVKRLAETEKFDLILAADCCYIDQDGKSPSTVDFVKACAGLCSEKTRCLVCFERRSPEVRKCLLEEAKKRFKKVVKLSLSQLPPELQLEYCDLWELTEPIIFCDEPS